ncbi:MAG TPA: glucan 1,4-alpha-glucosidase [Chloroflexota bacterium]|nr:glucan 1,4-alpha-glucosidase [Chloroflexota bacterium]
MDNQEYAPGWPGSPARWTSSAKSGVGTALSADSRVWFTVSHGILNEIYYPRVDKACTRDVGLIVTDGGGFFSEEKRHTHHLVEYLADGVPAFRLTNTCEHGRYRIEKEIFSDPQRDVVLQRTCFIPLVGTLDDYHLYVLVAPHLANRGSRNTAWVGGLKGTRMLFAERAGCAIAIESSVSWRGRSVGFVGVSDGWQDLKRHAQLMWSYPRAENGNVAMLGEVDLQLRKGRFDLAIGFGRTAAEAGHHARASFVDGFDTARDDYVRHWQSWQQSLLPLGETRGHQPDLYRVSTAILRTHEAKGFPGGITASLSIPWGFTHGDDDLGGYHLIWPRDLVEAAGGLLAAGAAEDARRVLHYLQSTQEADGHWPQNMWLNGTAFWGGVQMDETALPILLVDLARRENALNARDLAGLWQMVRRAASYLVQNGPVTQQDRWEEDGGYTAFTLAAETAALLVTADLADLAGEASVAAYLRETADAWNASIERWIYATNTALSRDLGVDGYYVRITPPDVAEAASPLDGFVPIKNRAPNQTTFPSVQIVSPDALALVRFGLRAPDDPRIVNTLKVLDARLKMETPVGPAWHRYSDDGYGEHDDGSPFDGTGTGRLWPLLTGERAHFELAAGRTALAAQLFQTMGALANDSGLISEQVWDSPDLPDRELYFGRPSGSAMPLVWAHAEYAKLCRSLHDGKVFDCPPQTVQRYLVDKTGSPHAIWRFNQKCRAMAMSKTLRIETLAPATVHWSFDDWQTIHDAETRDTDLGVHVVDLSTASLPGGATVRFTFYWPAAGHWEGTDFAVAVLAPSGHLPGNAGAQVDKASIALARELSRAGQSSG